MKLDAPAVRPKRTRNIAVAALLAGMGGTLPTLCKLAGASASDAGISIISAGHLVSMFLYFLIALILCLGLQEKRLREAFVMGIAAPALITNFLAGATLATQAAGKSSTKVGGFIASAHASSGTELGASPDSAFWSDFKRGLGFSVPSAESRARAEALQRERESLDQRVSELTTRLEANKSTIESLKGRAAVCPEKVQDQKQCAPCTQAACELLRPSSSRGPQVSDPATETEYWRIRDSVNISTLARLMDSLDLSEESSEMADLSLRLSQGVRNKEGYDKTKDAMWRAFSGVVQSPQFRYYAQGLNCELLSRRFAALASLAPSKATEKSVLASLDENDFVRFSLYAKEVTDLSRDAAGCGSLPLRAAKQAAAAYRHVYGGYLR